MPFGQPLTLTPQPIESSLTVSLDAQELDCAGRQATWLTADAATAEALISESDGSPWIAIARVVRQLTGALTAAVWLPNVGDAADGGLGLAAYDGGAPDAATHKVMADSAFCHRLLMTNTSVIAALPESTTTVLVVPLQAANRTFGLLTLPVKEGPGSLRCAAEQVLIAAFCGRSALVCHLIQTQQDKPQYAVADDRERIASDLNDHAVRELFGASLGLHRAAMQSTEPAVRARIEDAIELLDETIRHIRMTIFDLHE